MGKIADYANVLKSKLTDLFVVYQRNNGELETKNATLEQLGDAICGEQVHATLDTDDQTIIGGVNEVVSTKQNANVLNIVKQYTSGSSLDALQSIIAEYGKVSMIFAFGISGLGYYYGMLTFFSSTVGGGYFVNNSGRFWTIVYENGTITLTEKT